jgi:hypothetical protein
MDEGKVAVTGGIEEHDEDDDEDDDENDEDEEGDPEGVSGVGVGGNAGVCDSGEAEWGRAGDADATGASAGLVAGAREGTGFDAGGGACEGSGAERNRGTLSERTVGARGCLCDGGNDGRATGGDATENEGECKAVRGGDAGRRGGGSGRGGGR